jgi:hypothetical protein
MSSDTTDEGWGRSVWEKQEAAPVDDDRPSYLADEPEPAAEEAPSYVSPDPGHVAQDAPIQSDTYGGYDFDAGPPPTEEVPAGVMEDVGVSYNAPMNVPEPPPIPGILDRFTPPPVERQGAGGAVPPQAPADDAFFGDPTGGYSQPTVPDGSQAFGGRPSYLDTPGPQARQDDVPARKVRARVDDDDDDDEPRGIPMGPILLLSAALFFGVVLVGGVGMVAVGLTASSGGGEADDADPVETVDDVEPGVELRNDMRKKPGLIGVDGEEPVEEPDEEPVDDEEPEPAPVPDPEPASPKPSPSPAPSRPRPAPAPSPAPAAPAASSKGMLKVRSNRRVLIYVDDRAVGYAPQDVETSAGSHTVSAMIPGRPASKRSETVSVSEGGSASVDFTF